MNFHLHRQQGKAFLSTATEILYGGAAGGGKSHLIRVAAILWCLEIPGLQVYFFRRTFPDLNKNHMEGPTSFPNLLADLIQGGHCRINYGDGAMIFGNGSRIFLCHCQYEKDVENYRGPEFHVLIVDELTHFTEKMYRFLRSRCRIAGLEIPHKYKGQFPKVLCGTNPGGVGHNWVKAFWIDPAKEMEIWKPPKGEGGMVRQFIPAKLADNPTMMEGDPDYLEKLEGLGDQVLVRAMRDGDWNIVAGGMFDDVWLPGVVREPFAIPASWRRSRSFDWGSAKPFSVCWWAQSDGTGDPKTGTPALPKGTWVQTGEWYGWNGKPDEGCRMLAGEIARGITLREKEQGIAGKVVPGPADNSIYDVQNGNCIADDMGALGVRWVRADKGPGSRKNGWEKMRQLFKAATKHPMEEPGLIIFSTCRQTIRTIPTLPRDPTKQDDVDTDAEDHIGDAIRYRIAMPDKLAGAVALP